ncbi:MAG: beta-CASP ribonuclease aCPSF1, partial [Thermoplasmata archaeon]
MGVEAVLHKAEGIIREKVPAGIEITKIDFEGPIFVIYTKNLEELSQKTDIIKNIAMTLKRRVAVRPDPSLLKDEDEAREKILEIIPKGADVKHIYFEPETGEVVIEAINPNIIVGPQSDVLNEIKAKTGWVPKVMRAPPIESKVVREIRDYLHSVVEERRKILKKVGTRINRDKIGGEDTWIRMTALGGYLQVGRSASLLMTRDSKILIDCGLDVSNANSTPYLNIPEVLPIESIDAVVVTHAHLDHSGIVPALFKYKYNGPIYCTPPTRDLSALLQLDYLKVAIGEGKKAPYESSHIREAVKHTITLKYGETTDISPDVRLTFHNAGHILGSAIAHFHIGEGLYNIVFTGDMKYEKTLLFNPAIHKFPRAEALVMEATYGGSRDIQPTRQEAVENIKNIIKRTLERKGKVLIPVFAVGRSQEVMIVLEELMRSGEIPTVPVYLDGMIWEATAIHTVYPEYLNSALRTKIFQKGENPFLSEVFNRVDSREKRESIIDDPDPMIVLATSGMMNGGPVISYFTNWADDSKNTLIFVGYQAEGTLGRKIQKGWKEVVIMKMGEPVTIPINMDVETVDGFSGHSDRRQLLNYVRNMEPRPEKIIINHGEESKCYDLASAIYRKFGIETRAPRNLETVR